jgi:hypothetical protein
MNALASSRVSALPRRCFRTSSKSLLPPPSSFRGTCVRRGWEGKIGNQKKNKKSQPKFGVKRWTKAFCKEVETGLVDGGGEVSFLH